jgi:hypothetical protein
MSEMPVVEIASVVRTRLKKFYAPEFRLRGQRITDEFGIQQALAAPLQHAHPPTPTDKTIITIIFSRVTFVLERQSR